ncbi:MAG: GGDEF domain-containing protein [Acidimicrobiales bacterium]
MALLPRSSNSETNRARGASPDTLDTIISPRQVAQFSALLWGIGCLVGILIIVMPHGPTVHIVGWAGMAAFAALVATWTLWKGVDQPTWVNYILSVVALVAVSAAVLFANRSPVAFAVGGLFVLPTIFTASFYPSRVFIFYLFAQAGMSAAVLFTSGVAGAPAAWVTLVGTTSTVGIVVHLLQQALKLAATTDPLTGLTYRRALEPALGRELARCARLGHPLCLAVMDLDHFKNVNDEFGHQSGDRLLAEVSRAWCGELRATDVLARAGGDEFVLLLPSTDATQALEVLERLSRATSHPFSAGIAVATPGNTIEDVLHEADDACYQAKGTGGGQVVVAHPAAA